MDRKITSDTDDVYASTAHWAQEVARRRLTQRQPAVAAGEPTIGTKRQGGTLLGVGREIYMFAALVALYLNYYFMQVMVEIDSLPSIVVFVPVPGLG